MVDLAKRRRVMQRSIALGHCICDPKKACPCPTFEAHDVCLCAGETLEAPTGPVALTRLVEKAGCASKIDQASLQRILAGLPEIDDPRVLVGSAAGDDAGVYRIDDERALVQTVDVFCPVVDDPFTFGRIAAANSLSDVYAMGGRPLVALSIIGFPVREVPDEAMREILRGGIEAMNKAGVPVVGGHSIKDSQIKAGFAVTGEVDPEAVFTNAGARPGDALVLTKPIGTGVLSFAVQIDRAPEGAAEAIAESMAGLNKTASELMQTHGAHACTDVTGFGLMGHLKEMARASGVDVEVTWDDVPVFPGLLECLSEGIVPGGIERNRESSAEAAVAGDGVTEAMLDVCFDPQTSGGLLVALEPEAARAYVADLRTKGITAAAIIGTVTGEGTGRVHVETSGARHMPNPDAAPVEVPYTAATGTSENACCSGMVAVAEAARGPEAEAEPAAESACCGGECEPQRQTETSCCPGGPETASAPESSCCGGGGGGGGGAAQPTGAEAAFKAFLGQAGRPGALDAATKQNVNIALSVLAKCEPCLRTHVKKARDMGFSPEEIDEAAWMAIGFGGSPTMMWYKQTMRTIDSA